VNLQLIPGQIPSEGTIHQTQREQPANITFAATVRNSKVSCHGIYQIG